MNALFSQDGAKIELERPEYIFLALTLSYVLDGVRIADNDFRNILGLDRAAALRFRDELIAAERQARRRGEHWNPYPPARDTDRTGGQQGIYPSGPPDTGSNQQEPAFRSLSASAGRPRDRNGRDWPRGDPEAQGSAGMEVSSEVQPTVQSSTGKFMGFP